MTIKKKEASAF